MREHNRIAWESMVDAGVPRSVARDWTAASLRSIRAMGAPLTVANPMELNELAERLGREVRQPLIEEWGSVIRGDLRQAPEHLLFARSVRDARLAERAAAAMVDSVLLAVIHWIDHPDSDSPTGLLDALLELRSQSSHRRDGVYLLLPDDLAEAMAMASPEDLRRAAIRVIQRLRPIDDLGPRVDAIDDWHRNEGGGVTRRRLRAELEAEQVAYLFPKTPSELRLRDALEALIFALDEDPARGVAQVALHAMKAGIEFDAVIGDIASEVRPPSTEQRAALLGRRRHLPDDHLYFLIDRAGVLWIFRSLARAASWTEAQDVRDGEYRLYDCNGNEYEMTADSDESPVAVRPTPSRVSDPGAVADAARRLLLESGETSYVLQEQHLCELLLRYARQLPIMKRYWLEFDDTNGDIGPYRVGVTAFDLDDALRLVAERWYEGEVIPPSRVIEGVDVSTLPSEVRAHAGVPAWRGVWYPVSSIDPL